MQPPERYQKLDQETSTHSYSGTSQSADFILEDHPELRPGDHYNVLLRLRGLDPHCDSPCEILHTILLGEDKYVWHETSKVWNDEQGALFAACLQSSSLDGLNLPSLRSRYMVQYKKSLIGKHYKALQQLGVFHLDGLCSPALFELWKANGVLGALLWFPEIKNMDGYLVSASVYYSLRSSQLYTRPISQSRLIMSWIVGQLLTPLELRRNINCTFFLIFRRPSADLDLQFSLRQKSSSAGTVFFASVVSCRTIKHQV
jgi:hypothetical protein